MRQGSNRSIAAMLCIALAASGCSTTTQVWTGETAVSSMLSVVEPGDRVLLVRQSGRDLYCPFERADAEFLYGCRDPVVLRDILELRFRRMDGERRMTLADLRPGDTVTVTMRSGDVRELRLAAVDADTLRGEQMVVAIDQIDRLTVTRVSGARSLGMMMAVVAAVATVGAYFFVRQLADSES
jgi:hypothetical protein